MGDRNRAANPTARDDGNFSCKWFIGGHWRFSD
jgi:hypothetical protein